MADNEPKPSEGAPTQEHYGRTSLDKRYESLTPREKTYFDTALGAAGIDFTQLKEWVENPDILSHDNVEACIREIAVAISEVRLNFTPDKHNNEEQKALNKKMKDLVASYF